jgi:hypothetical protein
MIGRPTTTGTFSTIARTPDNKRYATNRRDASYRSEAAIVGIPATGETPVTEVRQQQ